jgi:hypothetical protein
MIHHQADVQIEVLLTYENRRQEFQMVGNFEDIGWF